MDERKEKEGNGARGQEVKVEVEARQEMEEVKWVKGRKDKKNEKRMEAGGTEEWREKKKRKGKGKRKKRKRSSRRRGW